MTDMPLFPNYELPEDITKIRQTQWGRIKIEMYHDDKVIIFFRPDDAVDGKEFEGGSVVVTVNNQGEFDSLVAHLQQNLDRVLEEAKQQELSSSVVINNVVDSLRTTNLELDLADLHLEP